MTVDREEVPANSVPAAAVRRRARALFVMIGCKGYVGGFRYFWPKERDVLLRGPFKKEACVENRFGQISV